MDTKKLRQKILDLAIHGKLVPQDPNDEPASVLLERIRKKKEQLIKEGKIKAPKKSKSAGDTSHYPKEGPWELPEGWEWCPIDELGIVITGTTPPKSDMSNYGDEYPFYKPTDLDNGINTITAGDNLSAHGYEKARKLPINSILVTCIGATIGKTGLIRRSGSCNQQINAIVPHAFVIPEYLYYCCVSEYGQDIIISNSSSTTLPILNKTKFSELLFPLPSKAEQERILKVIHCYLEIIEDIENKDEELHKLIQSSKVKIIDLALHGKLVPQDPSDEPAIELLKRINPDFRPSDNLHYEVDLPEGWVLCTLSEASNYGQCISVPVDTIENDAWVLELEDIEKDSGRLIRKLAKTERNISGIRHRFQKGQVLYSKLRTYLNKVLLAPDDGYCTTEIVPITPIKGLDPQYLNIVLRSPYFLNYTVQCGYGVKMPRLGTNDGRKAVIPIPPIAEQHRIVNKTNQLMSELELIATLNDVKVAE